MSLKSYWVGYNFVVNCKKAEFPFNKKDQKMKDVRASIIARGTRKFWYVRFEIDGKISEISTKILKTEKSLSFMKTVYLPVWIARKREEFNLKNEDEKKFSHYFHKFLILHNDDKSYHNRVRVWKKVNDFFGDMLVSQIKVLTVKDYLNSLELRNSSKKDYLNCIKGTLDIALDDEQIDRNVAFGISFKREEKAPIHVFSPYEVSLLLEKSEGMFRNYIGIALNTGMRSGEILGLMHSDIEKDRISIKRSVSKGRVTTPKTLGSVRDVPMFEALKPFILSQKKLSESLYLFDFDKTFIKDASFFKRRWHRLVEDCGIEYRKLYSTRHTFITAMLNSGKFKIMEIAAIVGHSSPEMIMKNYAGFIKDNHLKIDMNVDLFSDTLSDTSIFEISKNA